MYLSVSCSVVFTFVVDKDRMVASGGRLLCKCCLSFFFFFFFFHVDIHYLHCKSSTVI